MKIGILSDIHLGKEFSKTHVLTEDLNEYYIKALNFFRENDCSKLIIAGDLFDKEKISIPIYEIASKIRDYYDIEDLLIINGNHNKEEKNFFKTIYKVNSIKDFFEIEGWYFVLIDYQDEKEKLINEIIEKTSDLDKSRTILVCHQLIEGCIPNQFELSLRDIQDFYLVIAGHYHNPVRKANYLVPGSLGKIDRATISDRYLFILNVKEDKIEIEKYLFPTREIIRVKDLRQWLELKEKLKTFDKKPIIFFENINFKLEIEDLVLLEHYTAYFNIEEKSEYIQEILEEIDKVDLNRIKVREYIKEIFRELGYLGNYFQYFVDYYGNEEGIKEMLERIKNKILGKEENNDNQRTQNKELSFLKKLPY